MLYGYPKFQGYDLGCLRIGGTGLANIFFPWARLMVAVKKYGLSPLSPTWPQIKIGPFLRKEKDKRLYYDLFNTAPGHIKGIRKFILIHSLPALNEKDLYNGSIKDDKRDRVVTFEGMDGYFGEILREHAYVKEELLKITKEKHKKGLEFDFSGSISVHVRLADFLLSAGEKIPGAGFSNTPLPISWYIDIVTRIRSLVGADIPIYLFSDGTDEELDGLLRLSNTKRLFFGSSVADLIALSRAQILVASGSTFSLWASYLGRMPVIWHRGQMIQKLYYEKEFSEIESGKGDFFPDGFSTLIEDSIKGHYFNA